MVPVFKKWERRSISELRMPDLKVNLSTHETQIIKTQLKLFECVDNGRLLTDNPSMLAHIGGPPSSNIPSLFDQFLHV